MNFCALAFFSDAFSTNSKMRDTLESAAAFVTFSIISPGTLLQICGVSHKGRPELYEHMLDYLHGYTIGIPAVIMVQILSPFMVMDNGKQLVSLSATVLCLSDIAGDFINALVIRGGVFGMGVATSIAMWLQLLVLLMHFVKKEGYFRLSLKSLKGTHIRDIGQNGLISFVKKLATILRDILTNRINLVVAVSTAAVAAKGMQADLNMLMFCISIGIGRTLLTMSSMYYGAEDLDGLKRAYKYAMLLCIRLLAVVGVILFIAAPLVSRIYTSDPEVTALSVFSIRCMAISLVPDALNEAFQEYGLRMCQFSIASITIMDDEYRDRVEKAMADKGVMNILGDRWAQQQAVNILDHVATNPGGAGSGAAMGAGMGMGIGAGSAFASIAQQAFQPMTQQPLQQPYVQPSGRFTSAPAPAPAAQPAPAADDPLAVLGKLKKLLDAGLISEQEYNDKKREVLSRL